MEDKKAQNKITGLNNYALQNAIKKSSEFFKWYNTNIGYLLIIKTFTDEKLMRGGSHHLFDRYVEIKDKLEFWLYLDENNQNKLIAKYIEYLDENENESCSSDDD
jgi:hypothetical protein